MTIYLVTTGYYETTVEYYTGASILRYLDKHTRLQLWNEPGTLAIL